ncbi:helix-turn-helix domain-containing protein [Xylophilus rhododendri]|uniref:Helix-turn-helix domain-containing protein n=1 Tax=Xylophilus rhododendri TaxID=2697032 RepID=A0A857J037_9BURK|nr:IclR family transcriptional regulator [Xylophilus rhododendri]QHI97220.1 helix-turn-helix domain-containing protein [Xylophilus rhododendri]
MSSDSPDIPASGVQVIARAAAILREVTSHGDGRSLGQLAAATGLARSTVQRIVDALEAEHLVQAGIGGVRPGWGLRRLGELAGPGVARELRPRLYRLFESTGETVDLSSLAGSEVLFLDRFLSDQQERAVPRIDRRYPAYSMASGKALLAQLPDEAIRRLYGAGALDRMTPCTLADADALIAQLQAIRDGGFAYDLEEHALGICAIGIGLPPREGMPLAVSVVVPAGRFAAARAGVEQALKAWVQPR